MQRPIGTGPPQDNTHQTSLSLQTRAALGLGFGVEGFDFTGKGLRVQGLAENQTGQSLQKDSSLRVRVYGFRV